MSRKILVDLVFPLMIYKSPGDQQGPEGTTYRYKTVDNDVDLDSHLAADWHLTIADACKVKEPLPDPKPVDQLAIDLAYQPEASDSADSAPEKPSKKKS